jgi:hypothetical protein
MDRVEGRMRSMKLSEGEKGIRVNKTTCGNDEELKPTSRCGSYFQKN